MFFCDFFEPECVWEVFLGERGFTRERFVSEVVWERVCFLDKHDVCLGENVMRLI